FYLLGQSLEGMQVWDIRRAIQALKSQSDFSDAQLTLNASGDAAVLCLYASLFETGIAALELEGMPASHQSGPALLNVLRYLDLPQTLAMAATRSPVIVSKVKPEDWKYPAEVSNKLDWDQSRLQIKK
ncbi:MAG TPA: acetylxylan esterase, partial [Planctomycetaceae bacterium]|nr:acetylxylan esterase [Planctomycetaceae bacterium]